VAEWLAARSIITRAFLYLATNPAFARRCRFTSRSIWFRRMLLASRMRLGSDSVCTIRSVVAARGDSQLAARDHQLPSSDRQLALIKSRFALIDCQLATNDRQPPPSGRQLALIDRRLDQ
jgi:hypothetical protein